MALTCILRFFSHNLGVFQERFFFNEIREIFHFWAKMIPLCTIYEPQEKYHAKFVNISRKFRGFGLVFVTNKQSGIK